MTKFEVQFQEGDEVLVDQELLDEPHGDGSWGKPEAVVLRPVYASGIAGYGSNSNTTHSVGIRLVGVDYGANPTNCHIVANNRIRLATPPVTDEEVAQAINSIKESARAN